MTNKEAMQITMTVEQYFKDLGWDKLDIDTGMAWVSITLATLIVNDAPLTTKKYVEVLRAIANTSELIIESAEKEREREREKRRDT